MVARVFPSTLLVFSITLLLIACTLHPSLGSRINCCLPQYSLTGSGCISDTVVDDVTYYCVKVEESCESCSLNGNKNVTSSECAVCCATDEGACDYEYYVATSSWSKLTIHFYNIASGSLTHPPTTCPALFLSTFL